MSIEDESGQASKRRISGRQLAGDIRAGMDESALMAKYGLSREQLQRAVGKLVSSGVLSANELPGGNNEDPDLTLSMNLRACPVCKHPQPDQATECAKCGVVFDKVRADAPADLPVRTESFAPLYNYGWIALIVAGLMLLFAALAWTVIGARKEAQLAREEAARQEETSRAAELKMEELQQREQALVDREYDVKQAEYEERVTGEIAVLSKVGQRWTEDVHRKLTAYEQARQRGEARRIQVQTRQIRAEKTRAASHFRAYASIVQDIQSLGLDYRTRSLTRARLKQAAKSFQAKLYALKTFPSASRDVVRCLETGNHHLMGACQSRRAADARRHFEDFWREANTAMELMSKEIAAARG
jgi:hypothetical protein